MSYTEKMTKTVDAVSSKFTESLTKETKLLMWLETELRDCRNELCVQCGGYKEISDGKTLCEKKDCRWL